MPVPPRMGQRTLDDMLLGGACRSRSACVTAAALPVSGRRRELDAHRFSAGAPEETAARDRLLPRAAAEARGVRSASAIGRFVRATSSDDLRGLTAAPAMTVRTGADRRPPAAPARDAPSESLAQRRRRRGRRARRGAARLADAYPDAWCAACATRMRGSSSSPPSCRRSATDEAAREHGHAARRSSPATRRPRRDGRRRPRRSSRA